MASRRSRRRGRVVERGRPHGQALHGEAGLIAALLQQVVADLTSDHAEVRTEALTFLSDRTAVTFWCSLVDIDTEAFLEHVRALGPG